MSEITQSTLLVRAADCETMFSRTMIGSAPALVRLRPFGLRRDSLRHEPARLAVAGAASEGWWSQTGSNRRPHACKARALPAELWPRTRRRMLRTRSKWWAWEDLNFRPHAYQARALTN